jgi:hypothetical protein
MDHRLPQITKVGCESIRRASTGCNICVARYVLHTGAGFCLPACVFLPGVDDLR